MNDRPRFKHFIRDNRGSAESIDHLTRATVTSTMVRPQDEPGVVRGDYPKISEAAEAMWQRCYDSMTSGPTEEKGICLKGCRSAPTLK